MRGCSAGLQWWQHLAEMLCVGIGTCDPAASTWMLMPAGHLLACTRQLWPLRAEAHISATAAATATAAHCSADVTGGPSTATARYQEATSKLVAGAASTAPRRGGFMDGGGVTKDGELPNVAPEEVHSDKELKERMEQVGPAAVCWPDGLCSTDEERGWRALAGGAAALLVQALPSRHTGADLRVHQTHSTDAALWCKVYSVQHASGARGIDGAHTWRRWALAWVRQWTGRSAS